MSQEHPHSTPGRFFPKPVLTAFSSTGLLQRKSKSICEKISNQHNTPETPSKVERSKFIVPLNLTPFALTPKLMQAKSNSNNSSFKPTPLNQEIYSELGVDLISSLNNSTLTSSGPFDSSAFSETIEQAFYEDDFDQSFNQFLDEAEDQIEYEPDFDMDLSNDGIGDPEDEQVEMAAYSSYTEPWKSTKINFLNQWADDCIGRENIFFEIYSYLILIDFKSYYDISENQEDFFAETFEVQDIVGHGSFSVVYRVQSKLDHRLYAVKKTKLPYKGQIDR